jgi:hypothetical protein
MTGNSEPESSDSLRAFGEVLKAFRKRADLTQGRRLPPKEFIDRAEEALDAFGALRVRRGTCHGSRAWRPGSASGRGWRRRR